MPLVVRALSWATNGDHHGPSACDARERTIEFFRRHLGPPDEPVGGSPA